MAVIGIDLGTTNSLAAYWKEGEVKLIHDENNQVLFPSVVSYVENEGLVVGQQAKIRLLTNSKDTVASFKRFMGTEKKIYAWGQFIFSNGVVCNGIGKDKKKCGSCFERRCGGGYNYSSSIL